MSGIVRTLLVRGMLTGLLAGLLVFAFGRLTGEPQVDRAIAFEAAQEQAHAHSHSAGITQAAADPEAELVSRSVQASYGLLVGVVVYSGAIGGLFALVFAAVHGRLGRLRPRALSALLAAGGFVTVYLVPGLKYPANPPAVGEPDTIALRTALFFMMILISVVGAVLAVMAQRRLATRMDPWHATLLSVACYGVVVMVAFALLPAVNEVPDDFPAVVLWRFRLAAYGMQAILWAAIGLVFGAMAEATLGARGRSAQARMLQPTIR